MTAAGAGQPEVAPAEQVLDDEKVLVDEDRFNRVAGVQARQVLDYVARQIVDAPDEVRVESEEVRGQVRFSLHVSPEDRGKVIGRRGRVIGSIRTLVRAAGSREGIETSVEIPD